MKKFFSFLVFTILLLPVSVFATDANSSIYSGNSLSACKKYQDNNLTTDKSVYFSHCMDAVCINNNYKITYNSNNKVTCSNGNKSPYSKVVNKSACDKLTNRVCNNADIQYCSIIVNYDCSRTSSGALYSITTTTKKTTTRKPTKQTTTTTTTKLVVNTKLKSLALSNGNINFTPDNYNYSINVGYDINNIEVTAVPEDGNSKVEVKNNTNIENGSVISVLVTAIDGTFSEYKISVSKEVYVMSSNAKLKSLIIEGYQDQISFNPKFNEYTIFLESGVTTLNVECETQDEKATVNISGNTDIKDGSRITVNVVAEDGTKNDYFINIKVKEKSNFLGIIFIIILIIALLAGAYYVYKKLVQSKKGDKYEYE